MGFQEWRVREALDEGRVTVRDPRCVLVGAERYAAAGGRIEADLFGELPDRVLDPEILTALWSERAGRIAGALETEGFSVVVAIGDCREAPEALERFGYVRTHELDGEALETYAAARDAHDREVERARAADSESEDAIPVLTALGRARARMDAAGAPGREVTLITLRPAHETGIEAVCFGPPREEPELEKDDGPVAGVGSDYPPVDVEGVGHAQHRASTEMATLGLARAIADDPRVALIGLAGRMYELLALGRHRTKEESATILTAEFRRGTSARAIANLNGEIDRRRDERRAAQEASGLDPLEWVASLGEIDRSQLLAELFAVSLDLREDRTDRLRHPARAQARLLARLCDADLGIHWTPDEPYLAVHDKAQLVAMLAGMGAPAGDAATAKKAALVARVAAEASARRWLPDVLRWNHERTGCEAAGDDEAAPGAGIAA